MCNSKLTRWIAAHRWVGWIDENEKRLNVCSVCFRWSTSIWDNHNERQTVEVFFFLLKCSVSSEQFIIKLNCSIRLTLAVEQLNFRIENVLAWKHQKLFACSKWKQFCAKFFGMKWLWVATQGFTNEKEIFLFVNSKSNHPNRTESNAKSVE